jgi:hypothetical protein
VRDDAFYGYGLEHAREGLLEVIGQDQDFVRRLLRESPGQRYRAVEGSLAALLDAAVKNRIPRQAAVIVKGRRRVAESP